MFWLLAQQAEQTSQPEMANGWLIFWLLVGVLVLPYAIGGFIAKRLRMKDFGGRIGTVLLAVAATAVPFGYRIYTVIDHAKTELASVTSDLADAETKLAADPENETLKGEIEALKNRESLATAAVENYWSRGVGESFRLGIDLAGGTNLVYQIDRAKITDPQKDVEGSLDNMVGSIIRRVNPSGTEEVTVRRVGADRIEIIIPGADQAYVDEMKKRIVTLGSLEFQILATPDEPEHRAFIDQAEAMAENNNIVTSGGRVVARWVDIADGESISAGGSGILPCLLRPQTPAEGQQQQVLVAISRVEDEVTGEYLVQAQEQMDQTGRLVVGFRFDSVGAARFFNLTSSHLEQADGRKHRLAILLNGEVHSAPALNEAISDSGQISGSFTREEVRSLVSVLNAGALDIPLIETPISEFTISPLLGVDVRRKGVTALVISVVVVVAFMIAYYLKAGVIAVLCLGLNIFLIMGTMVFVQGTFTLPGLAGLVLTIGMAVDANVLIFERIREELKRGSSIRMAIHNGFDKAFSAIIDSNLTTLIVAVILFMIGTDQVKGFAVTLFIGIVMSMFAALYFGRLVFELLEQKRMLKKLGMMSLMESPNFDFIGKQKIAIGGSLAVIVIGMVAFFARGTENLDIDFRGGTMVTFEFDQPQKLSDFRGKLEEKFGASITVERLTQEGESQQADAGRRWRLRTIQEDVAAVESGISETLTPVGLRKVTVEAGELKQIAAAKSADADADTDKPQTDEQFEAAGFESGYRSLLTFSDEISTTTASNTLEAAFKQLPNGAEAYPEPEAMFRLVGVSGSGMAASENQVKKFDKMRLETRPDVKEADIQAVLTTVVKSMGETPLFEEVTNFQKTVGGEMQEQALVAMLLSLAAIIIYVWFRFQRATFGIAAVAALVHDVLVVLGAVALASYASGSGIGSLLGLNDFKINLPMIAAFLTIVGYSLNDTIVIFDRIREVRGKNPALTVEMVNRSLNQTLSRTLLTSLTTFFVVVILYCFGGEGIHGFAYCLLIGVVVGSYSSIYIASPVLLWLMNREANAKTTAAIAPKSAATSAS